MADDLRLRVILDLADRALAPLKRLSQGSKGLADQLRGARGELRQLEAQQQAISKFRALGSQFRASAANSQGLRQKLAELRAQTPANATAASALAQQIAATERALKKASATTGEQSQKLSGLRERMRSLGIKNVAAEEATLSQRISATNQRLDDRRAKLSALNKLQQQHNQLMMRVGIAAGAGMAMQAVGRRGMDTTLGPVRQFMSHEDAMLGIARQVPGARDEMGRLTAVYLWAEEQVRSLSGEIPLATTAIANMMTASARMEVPTDQLAAQVKLAAEMAIAFNAVPDEVAEAMGKVAKNYRIPVTQIRGLADAINYLDDNAISKGGDIIDYLNRTSGVISTVAMSAQQAAALGSTLLTLGERAETASTASNAIVQKLAAATKGSKKLKSAIAEIGMTPAAVQKGMATDGMGTLQKVIAAIGQLPKEKRIGVMVEMIGLEHSDTMAKLVDKPDELVRQLQLAQGTEAAGSMAREAQARYATLSAQWQMAQNRAFNLAATIGESLKPALVETMNTVAPLMERFRAWAQANPAVVAGVMKLALGLSAITLAAGALLVPLAMVFGQMAIARYLVSKFAIMLFGAKAAAWALWPALKGAAVALLALGKASVAFLVTPLGATLALLAGSAYLVWKNWDGIKGGLTAIWQDIASGANALWQNMVALKDRFFSAGADLINGLISGITARLGALHSTVVEAASSAARWFANRLEIRSPSRVFLELGRNIPEGAALGIEGGNGRLRAAALAMAALPLLAAPAWAAWPSQATSAWPALGTPPMATAALSVPPTPAEAALPALRAPPPLAMPALAAWPTPAVAESQALKLTPLAPKLQATWDGLPALTVLATLPALNLPGAGGADAAHRDKWAGFSQAVGEEQTGFPDSPMRPPASPGAGKGANHSVTQNFYVTVHASPGQDAQQVARAVAAELDRRERRRRADVRAALSDID